MEKELPTEELGQKYVGNVTGQHLIDVWNNRPIHDEIIQYFYLNLSTLFYADKSEFKLLYFPIDFINKFIKIDKEFMKNAIKGVSQFLINNNTEEKKRPYLNITLYLF